MSGKGRTQIEPNHAFLTYVADLELEVDRLRNTSHYIHDQSCEAVRQIEECLDETANSKNLPHNLTALKNVLTEVAEVLRDISTPFDERTNDQVTSIVIKPLLEQVFRWQQRVWNVPGVVLRIELGCETVNWFPQRLRHILDNLIANSLRHCDPSKGEMRLTLAMDERGDSYELFVSDNTAGESRAESRQMAKVPYQSDPGRASRQAVGLGVVKQLLEGAGGSLMTHSGEGRGTTFIALLPRYNLQDFLE